MLAQSSSAEVFYDKIRQELRVTSVHQCDSLKSLGRIIGAVTVAFLEEAPKYNHDDGGDDGDEVQSSDQVSHCLLDRSKVWEGIPSSLSLIPVPGAGSLQSPQRSWLGSEAREQYASVPKSAGKPSNGAGSVTMQEERNPHVEDVTEVDMVKKASGQLATSFTEKKGGGRDLVATKKDAQGERQGQGSKSSHGLSASVAMKQSRITKPITTRDDDLQTLSSLDQDKLSSPSVSNSIDYFWKLDPCNVRSHSPESSTTDERDISCFSERLGYKTNVFIPKDNSRGQRSLNQESKREEQTFQAHTSRRKDIENVVVKQEVFHDLCHSSGEAEDNRNASFSRFDDDNNGDENADMIDEEYLDSDHDLDHVKGRDSRFSTHTYLFGESTSSILNPYSGLGETAFPGIPSMGIATSVAGGVRAPSGFPFTLPPSTFSSHGGHRELSATVASSSIPRSRTTLPQYPSSSSHLHLRSQGKKGHRKVPACAVCYAEIRDKNDFATHASLHSLDDQHNCPVCLKIFSNRANLLRHSALHILGVLYQCPICCKMIKRGDNFQVHMRKQHPGQSVKMAKTVSDLSPDNPGKTFFTSTRSASTDDRFQWHGKSTDLVKLEPETSKGRPRYLSDGDDPCGISGSRMKLLADSSSEKDSLDLSVHPRPCPYCVNTYTSSTSLAHHIDEAHGQLRSRRHTGDRLNSRSSDDDIYPQYYISGRSGFSWTSSLTSRHSEEEPGPTAIRVTPSSVQDQTD